MPGAGESRVIRTVGILGAGKLGTVLGRLALEAGFEVTIAGSRASADLELAVQVLVPGASAASAEVAAASDIVVLALPLGRYRELPADVLTGRLVIDAMNYWPEVDGVRAEFERGADATASAALPGSTSELVQRFLTGARVVKGLNHMGYHDLEEQAAPRGAVGRRAIALAGDSQSDVLDAALFIDALGFDTLPIGRLTAGRALEPGAPAFGASTTADRLRRLVDNAVAA